MVGGIERGLTYCAALALAQRFLLTRGVIRRVVNDVELTTRAAWWCRLPRDGHVIRQFRLAPQAAIGLVLRFQRGRVSDDVEIALGGVSGSGNMTRSGDEIKMH